MKNNYKEFESEINLFPNKLKELIETEEKDTFEIKSIDFKNGKTYRKELFKPYEKELNYVKEKFKSLTKSNFSQAYLLRGDNLFLGKNKVLISDSKNYEKIQTRMKFLKSIENIEKFRKTTDTNLKYLLIFDFLFKERGNLKKLIGENLQNYKEKKYFDFKISKENFFKVFDFYEFGFLKRQLKIREKYFISNNKSIIRKLNKFNFKKKLNGDIKVEVWIKEKNYLYFLFKNGNESFYILSQRRNGNEANCSFININYLKLVGEFEKFNQ